MTNLTEEEDKLLEDLHYIFHKGLYNKVTKMVNRLDCAISERDERIDWLTRKLEAMIDTVDRQEAEINSLQGNLLDK